MFCLFSHLWNKSDELPSHSEMEDTIIQLKIQ